MKAIKVSEISHVVPLIAFSPVLTVLFSAVTLGEIPTIWGLAGVIVIVLGSYVANITEDNSGILGPLKNLKGSEGAKYMLIVTVLWTVTPIIEKTGIKEVNAFFWSTVTLFLLSIMYTSLALKRKSFHTLSKKYYGFIVLLGVLQGISYIAQMHAYLLTYVGYVVAIKRLSMLFSIVFGYMFFNEKNFKRRLLGGIFMVLGVLLIVFA